MFKKSVLVGLVVVILAVMVGGCNLLGGGQAAETGNMLPNLNGYKTIEGETLMSYLTSFGEGATLLAGHPELSATIAAVDEVVSCYQEIGAISARGYSKEDEPLVAGVVAIGDKSALQSPANFFTCVSPFGRQSNDPFQPCTANYILPKDDNEFYILYAGTTMGMCQTFCSNLEGCTVHQ